MQHSAVLQTRVGKLYPAFFMSSTIQSNSWADTFPPFQPVSILLSDSIILGTTDAGDPRPMETKDSCSLSGTSDQSESMSIVESGSSVKVLTARFSPRVNATPIVNNKPQKNRHTFLEFIISCFSVIWFLSIHTTDLFILRQRCGHKRRKRPGKVMVVIYNRSAPGHIAAIGRIVVNAI